MATLHIEGEAFETLLVPLNKSGRPGAVATVKFFETADTLDARLREKEERLWAAKVADAKAEGYELTNGFQYGLDIAGAHYISSPEGNRLHLYVAQITYSRIELAKSEGRRDVPNVLGLGEIAAGTNGYLFVTRGGRVAYHRGERNLQALVAGGYPRNLEPVKPEKMTAETWLEAQQKAEQAIRPHEVYGREVLGVVLDRTLGYKPELWFAARTAVNKKELERRAPTDAFERSNIVEFEQSPQALTRAILERESHLPSPSVLCGMIAELARIGGVKALDELNLEGRQRGTPMFEYKIVNTTN